MLISTLAFQSKLEITKQLSQSTTVFGRDNFYMSVHVFQQIFISGYLL